FLGEIPLDIEIRENSDRGRPPVVSNPGGPQARCYLDIADAVLAKLDANATTARKTFPKILFDN
ncbi:MAG: sodium:proton antiporter, partial [Geminicoccaceae bacterium]